MIGSLRSAEEGHLVDRRFQLQLEWTHGRRNRRLPEGRQQDFIWGVRKNISNKLQVFSSRVSPLLTPVNHGHAGVVRVVHTRASLRRPAPLVGVGGPAVGHQVKP